MFARSHQEGVSSDGEDGGRNRNGRAEWLQLVELRSEDGKDESTDAEREQLDAPFSREKSIPLDGGSARVEIGFHFSGSVTYTHFLQIRRQPHTAFAQHAFRDRSCLM